MIRYLNSPTPICIFMVQLSWGYTMTIKGSLLVSICTVKAFLKRNFQSRRKFQIFSFFWKMGSKYKFLLPDSKVSYRLQVLFTEADNQSSLHFAVMSTNVMSDMLN